jgi:hypothetical protein
VLGNIFGIRKKACKLKREAVNNFFRGKAPDRLHCDKDRSEILAL